jgi:hypothetical protein
MRFVGWTAFVLIIIQIPAAGLAADTGAVTSAEQACDILKRAVTAFCQSRENLTERCSCDHTPERTNYYVLGLHCTSGPASEVIASSLVGYYAIAKSNGAIFEWDFDADSPNLELGPAPPFGCL